MYHIFRNDATYNSEVHTIMHLLHVRLLHINVIAAVGNAITYQLRRLISSGINQLKRI